jgi:hypothetical protein
MARRVGTTVVTVAGFPHARIDVGPAARTVAVIVDKASACTARPGDAARITQQLRQALPFVRTVTVTVAGGGESLSTYVSTHCKSPRLPSGPGRIAYSQTGGHFATTKPFTVHSKRWTVDFENDSSFFAVFLLRNGKTQPQTITAKKRGVGSKTFTGAGTFQLKIVGSGAWMVRVRDAA